MVEGIQWTPVDCDYAGSVGSTPRPIPLMIPKPTKGFDGSIKALERTADGDCCLFLESSVFLSPSSAVAQLVRLLTP